MGLRRASMGLQLVPGRFETDLLTQSAMLSGAQVLGMPSGLSAFFSAAMRKIAFGAP